MEWAFLRRYNPVQVRRVFSQSILDTPSLCVKLSNLKDVKIVCK